MHHWQPLELLHLHHDIIRRRDSLRVHEHLVIVHVPQDPDVPPSRVVQVEPPRRCFRCRPTTADEREGEDLVLIDVVHADGFKDLVLDKMADAGFGHDGDGDGTIDFLDELGVGHSSDAAPGSDVGGDTLKSHDGVGLPGDASVG